MARSPETQTFQKNQRIISQGKKAQAAYLIKAGSANVFLDKDGKIVTLATLKAGEIFGEMALYSGGEYGANIEAAEDNTELEVITIEILKEKINSADPLVQKIMKEMVNRLTNTNSALLACETRDFIEIDLV